MKRLLIVLSLLNAALILSAAEVKSAAENVPDLEFNTIMKPDLLITPLLIELYLKQLKPVINDPGTGEIFQYGGRSILELLKMKTNPEIVAEILKLLDETRKMNADYWSGLAPQTPRPFYTYEAKKQEEKSRIQKEWNAIAKKPLSDLYNWLESQLARGADREFDRVSKMFTE